MNNFSYLFYFCFFSKFIISDVTLILEPLKQFCGFTEDEAEDMAILFCKYCANMRPANLEEHTFMYYFIANIISLQVNVILSFSEPNGHSS